MYDLPMTGYQTLDEPVGAECPVVVKRASMIHRWDLLTFLHWSYEPAEVQRLLPPGLTVDTYGGKAWVGLVPFMMEVRTPVGPAIPWLSRFCETNVRTYVVAEDGTRGVWFLSLDAARGPAVVAGRTTYRMPYFWSAMRLEAQAARGKTKVDPGSVYDYHCTRIWPGHRGATSRVKIRVGERYQPKELTDIDYFLTSRWRLYSHNGKRLRSAEAVHEPWPLHRAEAMNIDDQLVAAAGLAQPVGEPVVHWSPGTKVRIGLPHAVQAEGSNPQFRN